jgi:BirA family biotin operon repressor/biotin-[acetyl-CoA-carboxylase] ligase
MDVVSRLERFELVDSTNDVVAQWLRDGAPEVCVAVADRQSAGRGRLGRTWQAPPGGALLASLGFRPTWLPPDRAWRLAAIVALAAADAAEDVAGLPDGTVRLKWPNDLVVAIGRGGRPVPGAAALDETNDVDVRKLAGLLGESDGLGGPDPRVVIGIGLNADWPADAFPPDLAAGMTSLREASGGRPIDRDELLDAVLDRVATRTEAAREGYFDVAGWRERQLTRGRLVRLEPVHGTGEVVRAVDVDPLTGALVVAGPDGRERSILAGEIQHLRVAV